MSDVGGIYSNSIYTNTLYTNINITCTWSCSALFILLMFINVVCNFLLVPHIQIIMKIWNNLWHNFHKLTFIKMYFFLGNFILALRKIRYYYVMWMLPLNYGQYLINHYLNFFSSTSKPFLLTSFIISSLTRLKISELWESLCLMSDLYCMSVSVLLSISLHILLSLKIFSFLLSKSNGILQ